RGPPGPRGGGGVQARHALVQCGRLVAPDGPQRLQHAGRHGPVARAGPADQALIARARVPRPRGAYCAWRMPAAPVAATAVEPRNELPLTLPCRTVNRVTR